jgi:hypothetical protein
MSELQNLINLFVDKISTTFKIDAKKLHDLFEEAKREDHLMWSNTRGGGVQESKGGEKEEGVKIEETFDQASLNAKNKNDIIKLCRSRGFTVTGTKEYLIKVLLSVDGKVKKESKKKGVANNPIFNIR